MKGLISWLKSNPLTVIAVLVALGAGGFGFWTWQQSQQLSADIEEFGKEEGKLLQFTRKSVTLPPTELDGAAENISGVTYNQAVVDRLAAIYADVSGQADATLATITRYNQAGRVPLMPGFFPAISGDVYVFRDVYREAVAGLLNPDVTGNLPGELSSIPTLRVGLPPSEDELAQRVSAIVQEGLQTYGDNITEEQQKLLEQEQRQRLLAILIDRAENLDVYADPFIGDAAVPNSGFPLQVRPWVYAGVPPQPWQLWESQLEFWVQQDIVEAIRRANRIGEVVGTDEDGNEITGNLVNGVVKRLLYCEVTPGYVGLHVSGEMGSLDPQAGNVGRSNSFTPGSRSTGRQSSGRYPTPAEGAPVNEGDAVNANYYFAPTGRASNNVFDVRHISLVLHVDFQKLPRLYNAIASVNYMTIVDQRITAIDEFDFGSLGGPFLYGPGDIVQLELVIESLWLRSWTTPLMPDEVQTYLGITAGDGADTAF